jgi:D-sedoheptulose 7-phosphate isomerase
MPGWPDYIKTLTTACGGLEVTGPGGALSPSDGLRRWIELTRAVHTRGQHVYLIGNGASAAMASHFAADACKTAQLRASTFNDAALLTATANDLSFDDVFALPLSRLARRDDMLISISSSGRSANIVRALETARAMGMEIVTLSGKGADNPSRTLGRLNFYVPDDRYGIVESAHTVILHYWIDHYVEASNDRG